MSTDSSPDTNISWIPAIICVHKLHRRNKVSASVLSFVRIQSKSDGGFTLIEITLAIAIVAFAYLTIFSLLPIGMGVFRDAIDTSVSAQIVQRVVTDAIQTDFAQLINNQATGDYYILPVRYFSEQGTEVKVANPLSPTVTERQGPPGILYWIRVRGSRPGKADPTQHTAAYPTSLPSSSTVRFNPRDSTFLTVQIASNPAGKPLEIDASTSLIDPTKAKTAGIKVQTFSSVIARTSYPKAP